jgi:hypothetical protein
VYYDLRFCFAQKVAIRHPKFPIYSLNNLIVELNVNLSEKNQEFYLDFFFASLSHCLRSLHILCEYVSRITLSDCVNMPALVKSTGNFLKRHLGQRIIAGIAVFMAIACYIPLPFRLNYHKNDPWGPEMRM